MIPQGLIFRELRAEMLSNFPDGSKAVYEESGTIGEWLSKGSLVIKQCSKDKVIFEAPKIEFGISLLTEIENLFNHCFEQLQELGCVGKDTRVRSQAWYIVTSYYFAFYSGSILLRLLGRPILFLKRDQLKNISKLLGNGITPGQGSYKLNCLNPVSSIHSEFSLCSTSKIHEATWTNLFEYLDQLRKKTPSGDVREVLFYESLCTKTLFNKYINFQWPSIIRNQANYRPGFAYKLDTSRNRNCKLVSDWAMMEPLDLSKVVCDATRACGYNDSFEDHVRLMTAIGLSLFILARDLYSELLVRKRLDKRWEIKRKSYKKKMVFTDNVEPMFLRTF